jgi:LmbE family N-acetylglucosaminyl deacetylase
MPVEIWTICAGDPPPGPLSPFAERTHADWGTGSAADTVALRRVEDRNAARRVGAVAHHFSVPDCIYRRSAAGDLLYTQSVFTPVAPQEAELVDEIAGLLRSRLTAQDTVVCPLAIGGHIDHVLTRRAAEQLSRPLLYYADIPYLFKAGEPLAALTGGMPAAIYSVTEGGAHAWQDGIAAYASQLSTLFPSLIDMRLQIEGYRQQVGGIRLWLAQEGRLARQSAAA